MKKLTEKLNNKEQELSINKAALEEERKCGDQAVEVQLKCRLEATKKNTQRQQKTKDQQESKKTATRGKHR